MSSFLVSGKEGITDADEYVARKLYETHKLWLLLTGLTIPRCNDIYDFTTLLVGRTSTNLVCPRYQFTGDVLDAIVENLPHEVEEENPDVIRIQQLAVQTLEIKFDQRHFGKTVWLLVQ